MDNGIRRAYRMQLCIFQNSPKSHSFIEGLKAYVLRMCPTFVLIKYKQHLYSIDLLMPQVRQLCL